MDQRRTVVSCSIQSYARSRDIDFHLKFLCYIKLTIFIIYYILKYLNNLFWKSWKTILHFILIAFICFCVNKSFPEIYLAGIYTSMANPGWNPCGYGAGNNGWNAPSFPGASNFVQPNHPTFQQTPAMQRSNIDDRYGSGNVVGNGYRGSRNGSRQRCSRIWRLRQRCSRQWSSRQLRIWRFRQQWRRSMAELSTVDLATVTSGKEELTSMIWADVACTHTGLWWIRLRSTVEYNGILHTSIQVNEYTA